MARLIEVGDAQSLPPQLSLRTGDLLVVRASGGFVSDGETIIERLGPFVPGSLQADGTILEPIGSPSTILFRARQTGRSTLSVSLGDPFFNPQLVQVVLHVVD